MINVISKMVVCLLELIAEIIYLLEVALYYNVSSKARNTCQLIQVFSTIAQAVFSGESDL